MFPLEVRAEVNHEETRVMVLSSSEGPMIVAGVVLTQCQRVTDGQTDGRTDGFTIAALCIASYADALTLFTIKDFIYLLIYFLTYAL